MASHSCPRCSPSVAAQVFHGPHGCPLDAIERALKFDAPALSRMGVTATRWEKRRIRFWMFVRRPVRAQRIILRAATNGSGKP